MGYSSVPNRSPGDKWCDVTDGISADVSPRPPNLAPPGSLMACAACSVVPCHHKPARDDGVWNLLESWLPGPVCCRAKERAPAPAVVLEAPTFCSATFDTYP